MVSTHSPLLAANKTITHRLINDPIADSKVDHFPSGEESKINSSILRKHFLELTTRFLAPFEFFFRAKWSLPAKKIIANRSRKSKDSAIEDLVNPYLDTARFLKFDSN